MPRAERRFLLAGLAVAAVEAGLGVLAIGSGLEAYLFAVAVATALVAIVARRLLEPPDDPPDDPGRGGGAPEEPPPWWPQFEADLRRHLQDRDRPGAPV